MRKYLSFIVPSVSVFAGALAAHAQDLGDYENLNATKTLTFANTLTGSMYDQLGGIVPFLIQVAVVLLVIGAVLAIPYIIIRGVLGLVHLVKGRA